MESGFRIGWVAWASFSVLAANAGEGPFDSRSGQVRATLDPATSSAGLVSSSDEEKSAGMPEAFSAEESIHWLRALQMLKRWSRSSMTTKRRKQQIGRAHV